jgi:hypothetical protein
MTEGTVGGALLRRAILLLVVAVVVASMVAAASPAFAVRHRDSGLNFVCTDPVSGEFTFVNGGERQNLEDQGFTCVKMEKRR